MANPSEEVGYVHTVQTKLIWRIRDFPWKACKYNNMTSPVFMNMFHDFETKWQLSMSLEEKDKDGEEYIGLSIKCLNNKYLRLLIHFAILDVNDMEAYKYVVKDDIIGTEPWGVNHFIKTDKLFNEEKATLINQGTLTIICIITNNPYIKVENHKNGNKSEQALRLEESKYLLNLFHSGTHSDIVFNVEGKKICAHKNIIANRSPVFGAMFGHDMEEARMNSVVVEDISYSAMFDLLKFIYSATVPLYTGNEQYTNYLNLMVAANKYGIDNLKKECERRVSINLQVDNVFESLNLADTYNAQFLKECAIDFIASNAHRIIETPAYKEFGKLHPELSCEVFRALVIKRRKTDV